MDANAEQASSRTVSGQAPDVSLVDALREHNASLKIEDERLAGQLAEAQAQASRSAAIDTDQLRARRSD